MALQKLLPNKPLREAAQRALTAKHSAETMLTAYDQLKPTERVFVDAYLATDNPKMAMRAANASLDEKLLDIRAVDMLKRPLVQAAMADKLQKLTQKYEVTLERTVREIAKIGYANMADYVRMTDQGEPFVDLSDVTYDEMAAIKSVSVEDVKEGRGEDAREIRKVKFELHDKRGALDMQMKYLGGYAPVGVSVTGPNGGPLQIDARVVTVDMTAEQAADYYARSLEES